MAAHLIGKEPVVTHWPVWKADSNIDLPCEPGVPLPNVGVPEIDEDHGQLITHYRALLRALGHRHDQHAFVLAYHGFLYHVRQHFAREERLMQKIDYPDYNAHKTVHKRLLRDAEELLVGLIHGSQTIKAVTVTRFFQRWLMDHINTHDRKIGTFLSSPVWDS